MSLKLLTLFLAHDKHLINNLIKKEKEKSTFIQFSGFFQHFRTTYFVVTFLDNNSE